MDDCRFDLRGEMFKQYRRNRVTVPEKRVSSRRTFCVWGFFLQADLCVPKGRETGRRTGLTQKRMRDGSTPRVATEGRAKGRSTKSVWGRRAGAAARLFLEIFGRAVGTRAEWDGRLGRAVGTGGWDGRLGRAVGTRLGRAVGPVNDGQRGAGRRSPLNPSVAIRRQEKICRLIPTSRPNLSL